MTETIPTPHGPFLLRPAETEDTPKLLALWHAAFGKTPDPGLWAWKYSGPFGSHTTVAEAPDGRLAVAFPTVPVPARLAGTPVTLELAMDSASHPAFRDLVLGRQGLFARTARLHFARAAARGAYGLYGFPGPRHFRLGQLLLGYLACSGQPCCAAGRPRLPLLPRLRLTPCSAKEPLDWVEALDARLGPPTASCRSAAFVHWRLAAFPGAPYRIWQVRGLTGRVQGYAATLDQGQATRVVDLLLPPHAGLVRAALAQLGHATAKPLELWLSSRHPLAPLMAAAGLAPAPDPIGAVAAVRPLAAGGHLPLGELTATLADTDVDGAAAPLLPHGGAQTPAIFFS
jgi:hypothetical protein